MMKIFDIKALPVAALPREKEAQKISSETQAEQGKISQVAAYIKEYAEQHTGLKPASNSDLEAAARQVRDRVGYNKSDEIMRRARTAIDSKPPLVGQSR